MFGDGGQGNHIFADFQAKLLGAGQPQHEDPAEEHMNNVKKLVFRWTAALVLIAGAGLWIGGPTLGVAATAGATLVATAILAAVRQRRGLAA
jgi:hypothetical protein